MTDAITARPRRLARKPNGRKTANRFAKLAGGDITLSSDTALADASPDNGLIGAMSAVAADESMRVEQIPVAEVAPHPFNDPHRSLPQPGSPKWDELVNGVRANGVQLPVLAVPRDAFLASRPSTADHLPAEARYVLVYGHRRRAAALEAGRSTVPAIVDASIMVDDGDLDAMVTENLGRQDLTDLAEADLFARYSEIGLSQRALASRLGIDQATVSRRLALLLLAPEVRNAVETGAVPSTDAAALAGALPYGPPRRWQKTKDPQQTTDQRRDEQVQALRLVLQRGMTSTRAAERVIAEREARAQAKQWGIPVVNDPRAELGESFYQHRVPSYDPSADLIAAIDPGLGTLILYTAAPSPSVADAAPVDDGGPSVDVAQPEPRPPAVSAQRDAAAARTHRRQACAALAALPVTNPDLLQMLIGQYLSGVAVHAAGPAVSELLGEWNISVEGNGNKARAAQAWQRAIAAAEVHASERGAKPWDAATAAHVQLLIDRVGYQPTEWERGQLGTAR